MRMTRTVVVLSASASLLVAGCSNDSKSDDLPTIPAAVAAQSPATSTAPAGTVQQLGVSVAAMVNDTSTGVLALLSGDGKVLLNDPAGPPRTVDVAGASSIAAGKPGEVLVTVDNAVVRVDVKTGTTSEVKVDGMPQTVARLADDRLAVGFADGKTSIIDPNSGSAQQITGLVSVDALAVTGESLSALDRRQTSLTDLDLEDGKTGLALRAGDGATNLATDHFGRILVTDTTDGELLVFTSAPLVLRQRYPVGSSPYAVVYDDRAEIAWVTLTGSNEVVGFDLATGIPVEVKRYPTVRQPNSVAVDSSTGTLFVGSATGDGLQRIGGG
jgi:outer membrane murein-binding lipoprotein Lpp